MIHVEGLQRTIIEKKKFEFNIADHKGASGNIADLKGASDPKQDPEANASNRM